MAPDAPIQTPLPDVARHFSKIRESSHGDCRRFIHHIRKRIPIGGGSGGGSRTPARLRARLSERRTRISTRSRRIDGRPVLLTPQPTWVTGIGEKSKAAAFLERTLEGPLLVVCLPKPTDSGRSLSQAQGGEVRLLAPQATLSPPRPYAAKRFTTIWVGAQRLGGFAADGYRSSRSAHRAPENPVFFAGMSGGSGSTCFAIYDDALDRAEKR